MALKGLSHPSTLSPDEIKDINEVKVITVISYFWLAGIVVYFLYYGKSKFAIHHARQGVILGLVWSVVASFPIVGLILSTFVVLFGLYGMLNAYLGEYSYMPLFGKYIMNSKEVSNIESLIFSGSKLFKAMKKAKEETQKSDDEFSKMAAGPQSPEIANGTQIQEVEKQKTVDAPDIPWYEKADTSADEEKNKAPQWE